MLLLGSLSLAILVLSLDELAFEIWNYRLFAKTLFRKQRALRVGLVNLPLKNSFGLFKAF